MLFRTVLSAALALPLCLGGTALARNAAMTAQEVDSSFALPLQYEAPAEHRHEPIVLAQANDPRITAIEEQIRQLNGRIEELNFQILQMQDQMRKMQEDNEFRFQQLEGSSDGGNPALQPLPEKSEAEPSGEATDIARSEPAVEDEYVLGEPPRTFGTITFDADGNVVTEDWLSGGGSASGGQADDTTVAALPPTDDPEELYRNSYEFILSGDYRTAEAGFREHLERFPDSAREADVHFWLGEALLGQDRYRDAAEVFLRASRDYPDARKAPDTLLKLGISLAAMNQRDVACATYDEIGRRFPDVSDALAERVKQEEALAGC